MGGMCNFFITNTDAREKHEGEKSHHHFLAFVGGIKEKAPFICLVSIAHMQRLSHDNSISAGSPRRAWCMYRLPFFIEKNEREEKVSFIYVDVQNGGEMMVMWTALKNGKFLAPTCCTFPTTMNNYA